MTIPGIGPITATAIAAVAPPAETFAKGRDFAAWLGLVPKQRWCGVMPSALPDRSGDAAAELWSQYRSATLVADQVGTRTNEPFCTSAKGLYCPHQ